MTNKNARRGPGANTFKNRFQSITFAEVKQRARHQWPAVLAGLGIDPAYLRNRHGPCPACGGKDRFRFDDREGHGTFYCNQCGAGDGFSLLSKVHGWTALEALQAVGRWLGMVGFGPTATPRITPPTPPTSPAPATIERMQDRIKALWRAALPGEAPKAEAGRAYLEYRGLGGLSPLPGDVRLHPSLPYWFPGPDGKPVELGSYPALLALVRDKAGKVRGLHRTYLQQAGQGKALVISPTGEPLPAKKLLALFPGATRGCAIRLYPVTEGKLAVAEGIETALAVTMANPGWPCWSTLFSGNLANFDWPEGLGTLAICMDNDENQAGQKAGKSLARRLFRLSTPPVIKLLIPDAPGTDWLDVWGDRHE